MKDSKAVTFHVGGGGLPFSLGSVMVVLDGVPQATSLSLGASDRNVSKGFVRCSIGRQGNVGSTVGCKTCAARCCRSLGSNEGDQSLEEPKHPGTFFRCLIYAWLYPVHDRRG